MNSTTTPQKPGCLPDGYTLDSMLTPEQFCVWVQKSLRWWTSRCDELPGVTKAYGRYRIHPRTHLERAVGK